MPDEYLDGPQAGDRISMWRGRIARTDLSPPLVADIAGEVVGFAEFGATQSRVGSPKCGQLHAINLDPTHWGKGIGRSLLRRATEALREMGYEEAVLWVVPENDRARALYESEGWVADGDIATDDVLGVTVSEVRYRRSLLA
jgi:ribosomal protein S18 acetylase RimI-like enzyme